MSIYPYKWLHLWYRGIYAPLPHPQPDPGHFLVNAEGYDLVFLSSFFFCFTGRRKTGQCQNTLVVTTLQILANTAIATASVKNQARHHALAVCHTLMQRNQNGGNKEEKQRNDAQVKSRNPQWHAVPLEGVRCQYYHFHALREARNLTSTNIEKCYFKETELGNKMKQWKGLLMVA